MPDSCCKIRWVSRQEVFPGKMPPQQGKRQFVPILQSCKMRTASVGRDVGKGVRVGPGVLVMVGTVVAVGVNVWVGGIEVWVAMAEAVDVGKSGGAAGIIVC